MLQENPWAPRRGTALRVRFYESFLTQSRVGTAGVPVATAPGLRRDDPTTMIGSFSAELLLFQLRLARPPLDDIAAATLQRAVDSYVDELRLAGWTLQQTIVAIKRLASDAGFRPTTSPPVAVESLGPDDSLLVALVRWAVDRYAVNVNHGHRAGPTSSLQYRTPTS